jgi:hypothetical protein
MNACIALVLLAGFVILAIPSETLTRWTDHRVNKQTAPTEYFGTGTPTADGHHDYSVPE